MDCSETLEKVKQSIALVVTLNANRDIMGKGSGFVFSRRGILVTCNHVVKDASSVVIRFPEGEFINAEIAIRDEEHDIALLKFIEDKPRQPLEQAGTSSIKEGMPVIFSGYPLSLNDLTTHQGILSAIIKDVSGLINYLIDGTVNSGNSGCPLLTQDGQVIGIVNAKRRENSSLLSKVEQLSIGTIALHGLDLIEVFQALINNVQLGIGYAVPCSYVPEYRDSSIPIALNKPDHQND